MSSQETVKSVFERKSPNEIYEDVRSAYFSDERPWIIGYSGGKDSTTALQVVWHALEGTEKELGKPIYVISSDTLVENPLVYNHIESTLKKINEAAEARGLPFNAQKVYPKIEDSFWTNLIGKGYPAPYHNFRWCTERLKIQPANQFIRKKIRKYGQAVMVLGIRKSESKSRASTMEKHRIAGHRFRRHSSLSNAFIYAPIADWREKDVWTYLIQVPSPWGGNNRELVSMYRQTHSGDCPLVVDTDAEPTCGNSRFGCWTCTVIDEDKAIKGLIENGEDWLRPLLNFQNLLRETMDPEVKHKYRSHRHLDGRVYTKDGGTELSRGPYRLSFRKKLLRKLLEIQKQIRENGPNPEIMLIRKEELWAIRRIWRTKAHDWTDSVPKIYEEATGKKLDLAESDLGVYNETDGELLEEICGDHQLPPGMLWELIELERRNWGMAHRPSIYKEIENILKKDWRTEDEVLADLEAEQEREKL